MTDADTKIERSITTVKTLQTEVNLERWDSDADGKKRTGVPVRVRTSDGCEFNVVGVYSDLDALVLAAESVAE